MMMRDAALHPHNKDGDRWHSSSGGCSTHDPTKCTMNYTNVFTTGTKVSLRIYTYFMPIITQSIGKDLAIMIETAT